MAPGSQPHTASTWWATLGTSDINVTPPASITDIPWAVISMCTSGACSSLPPLPQPLPPWGHHLGICMYIWRGSGQGYIIHFTHSWPFVQQKVIAHPSCTRLYSGNEDYNSKFGSGRTALTPAWHSIQGAPTEPQKHQEIPSFLALRLVAVYYCHCCAILLSVTKCSSIFLTMDCQTAQRSS